MSGNNETTSRTDTYVRVKDRDKKRIQNVKTGGHIAMYIGAAGLMMPQIQKSRESNAVIRFCSLGAGALLSVGLGKLASKIFDQTVDKAIDFWDDVKPSGPNEEEKKDG